MYKVIERKLHGDASFIKLLPSLVMDLLFHDPVQDHIITCAKKIFKTWVSVSKGCHRMLGNKGMMCSCYVNLIVYIASLVPLLI